ncbi:hypothetical protein Sste5344_000826 [Sporothrix stenoceras]
MERKRATARFATGPARRPPKDAIDSDDEMPPPHEGEHSSNSSVFPQLELYEEGDEQADDLIQSQLQVQEETESQERRRQQQQQQDSGEPSSPGDLWGLMSDGENDIIDENDENDLNKNGAVPVHDSPKKPPRKRRRKAAVEKPRPTAATKRSRRGRLGVTSVLEQMSAAIERAQPEDRAAQRKQQQQEEEEEAEAEAEQQEADRQQAEAERQEAEAERRQDAEQQQAEADYRRREEEDQRQSEEVEAPAEETRHQSQNEQQEEEGEERAEEREVEMEEGAPEGTPERPPPQQQDREVTAPTPSRMSRRLRGREPTTELDAPETGDGAEVEANGAQPSTQRSAQTIQESPQATVDSGLTDVQPQGNDLNDEDEEDGNHDDDDDNDAKALPRISGSSTPPPPPVTTPLSIKTLNALLELMGSAGWTGKATWKIGLNWQHIDPGQFGPEPFTEQARNLLRQLGYLTNVYVQVPRPNAQRSAEYKSFDMRIQRQYLQDHDGDSAALFLAIDGLVNGVCHDALQPLTTYAVDTTRETVRFRWLLADDLVEFVIPKAVELLETVYALGGSLPDKEVGVSAVYVPRNTVKMIHATLYTARRLAGWIIRLENALAWELGYRADRRIPGGRITYLEDDDFDYEDGHRSFRRRDDADAPPPPVSVATKRRDRSRLKPLLNMLEDELGLAWVAIERARATQEATDAQEASPEVIHEVANEQEDDDEYMPIEAAVSRTLQTLGTQARRKRGRLRKEDARERAQPSSSRCQQQQTEPEREETPLGTRRARAVLAADWSSSGDEDDDYDESRYMYEPSAAAVNRRGDESVQIVLSQPPPESLEQAVVDINDVDGDDDDVDVDDDGNYEDDGQDDSPVMTTAAAAAAASDVRQSSPPVVVSVEQETQDMIVVETSEPEQESEEEADEAEEVQEEAVVVEEVVVEDVVEVEQIEEAKEAEEAGEEDDQAADAMQVDSSDEVEAEAEVEAEVQIEAPATPATDIPTPAPTPTPTPSPEPVSSAPVSFAAGPRPYVDTELKQILARLRMLKGTAQLDLVKLAADLNRDVFDVANRAEGIKSVVRAKLLRDKKPVPHWAQAGYTIR